jgi:uncharacterized repeat protein (TIGR03806 family)
MLLRKPGKQTLILKSISLSLSFLLCVSSRAQIQRMGNNTLNFPATPQQQTGDYILKDAFPGLYFNKPVAIRTPPGESNLLYVVERAGRVLRIENLTNPVVSVFLDIRDRVVAGTWEDSIESRRTEGLSSIAFHPGFRQNGRFFVTYNLITNTSQGSGHHNRVSEFKSTDGGRTASPSSELPLITQFDEGPGHNINDAHFGPDGYLYIASGDEGDGGNGDDFHNAQRIDKDFFSAVFRIDVDKRPGNLPPNPHPASSTRYSIPADNPFIGTTSWQGGAIDPKKVRTEFWAIGLRNPWRISFDSATGDLYEGDVGQHGREEINKIVRGGNYGWSYREGDLIGPAGNPSFEVNLIPPLYQYGVGMGPYQGYSVTGGVVYRGSRLPLLTGHLVFADFVSGNVWIMDVDHNGQPNRILSEAGIAGFGYDPRNGDVILINHNAGVLKRLDVSGGTGMNLPLKLSQAGIFSDLASLTPHPGIYPYEVNLPFWSDGAAKRRWFSLPRLEQKIRYSAEAPWAFPSGAVWVKHFDIQTNLAVPSSLKRIETRVLVKNDAGMYGVTYRWNDAGTEADLVSEDGETNQISISNGTETRQQNWIYPSRQDCLTCHTPVAGWALGFNTAQLNRPFGTNTTNQIIDLANAGFFVNPPASLAGLKTLSALDDESVSRTYRVKSYLQANCANCHQPGGAAGATWDGRITTALSDAHIIDARLQNNNGNESNRVVALGDVSKSALVQRISTLGSDRMPPLGSALLDTNAIALLSAWIREDKEQYETFELWRQRLLASEPEEASAPDSDPDADGLNNYAEFLSGSDPLTAGTMPVVAARQDEDVVLTVTNLPNRAIVVESNLLLGTTNQWELKDVEFNKLIFPSQPLERIYTVPNEGEKEFFRFRIIEP